MTDPDETLRRELGWTASQEAGLEPDTGPTRARRIPESPAPQSLPGRPPVDYVPAKAPSAPSNDGDTEDNPPGLDRVAPPESRETAAEPQAASFRDGERPRTSFRERAQHHQPPDTHQAPPNPGRPENPWKQQQGWQGRPQRPPALPTPPPSAAQQSAPQPAQQPTQPFGPPAGQPWPAEGFAPEAGSYADRIRVHDLVPPKRQPPAGGWRLLVYKATFGRVNPAPSAQDIRQGELEAKIKGVLRGHYKVGVMGKGGVGKTTVSASIGSVFAELRQDDRVVAIDADTSFGKLGSRVDPRVPGSYWELAADKHLDTFADVRSRVGNNAAGLFVLAGEASPARRRVLDPAIYREATTRLDRHFSISIVDCSSTMDSPVTQEVLRDLDALIVVSSPWVDGASVAGQTLDWLANRGMTNLLQRTVVVLNDSDGHADKRTRSILAQQFAGQGQAVVEVPFDGHLRPGGVIDGTRALSGATRRRFLEIAAALADHFPTTDDRSRERN